MRFFIIILLFLLKSSLYAQHTLLPNERNWLQKHTISFNSEIGDIQPQEFSRLVIPDSTRIIGLGEANHGSKEFQVLKYKLAAYLIQNHDFNIISIEFPYTQGLLLNDYVLGKDEDGLRILTDQLNSEYNNTQFIEFVDYIKAINKHRSANKIQFLGGDIFGKPYAVKRLITYFRKTTVQVPSVLLNTADLYQSLSTQEDKQLKPPSKTILNELRTHHDQMVKASSLLEFNRMTRLAELLAVEWKGNQRVIEWAKSTLHQLNENKDNKILLLAHNGHIKKTNRELGRKLARRLGNLYFAIGTDYNAGSFALKNLNDRAHVHYDSIQVVPMPDCLAEHINQMNGQLHYLKTPTQKEKANAWLFQKIYTSSTGMGYLTPLTKPVEFKRKNKVTKQYDALFILKEIHPSHLLKNTTPLNPS
ncbi:erythromycin esterase family protein [Fulvivirga maritima]|uniref:erythromycin esterase family protein n=1 Tax=Fulvivirga maritima TaxID=2904247 RepID=UPI001F22EDA1|nr:erythromycin esterase family protein [Fulvivirga maritima]UII26707.1 erythromycin esterase family protein [Fulvivirga maritima]